jgi:hypothetical protein
VGNNRQEYLQKALENFKFAQAGFNKLKADGNLQEVDSKIIGEIETEIEKINHETVKR